MQRHAIKLILQIKLFQDSTWPEYQKRIALRSKAGFGSIHNELLHRNPEIATQNPNYRHPRTKQLVRQSRTASKLFGYKTKSKDIPEPTVETFISYVTGDDNSDTNITDQEEQHYSVIATKANTGAHDKNPKQVILNDRPKQRGPEYDHAAVDKRVLRKCNSMSDHSTINPVSLKEQHSSESCSPPKTPVVHFKEPSNIGMDAVLKTNTDGETEPIYSNFASFPKISNVYEKPNSPVEDNNETFLHIYANTDQNTEKTCGLETNNDYIDMQGVQPKPIQRSRKMSCPAIKSRPHHYDSVDHSLETMHSHMPKSAPNSPSINDLRKTKVTNVCDTIDDENEYITPDIVEHVKSKTPISATVAPYIQEVRNPAAALSLSPTPFFLYSVEEVVQCFVECALTQLAKLCKEENLDGEFFRDITDDVLMQEPFCLKPFHVSKVRKIIEGWRPRRMTFNYIADPMT